MQIYVASSWRNPYQPTVVQLLRADGHRVFDFRHPDPTDQDNTGFRWSDVDQDYRNWSLERYVELLDHPISERAFGLDMGALIRCDACVMVMPCGTSSHLELGYAKGAGKVTAILYPIGIAAQDINRRAYNIGERFEPELMVKMADELIIGEEQFRKWRAHWT